jgi:hypothetical protein
VLTSSKTLGSCLGVQTETQDNNFTTKLGLAPSFDTFLPALSEDSLGGQNQVSENSSLKDSRGNEALISRLRILVARLSGKVEDSG